MTYRKPQLLGCPAIRAIQEMGNPIKFADFTEPPPFAPFPSDPAYQADE